MCPCGRCLRNHLDRMRKLPQTGGIDPLHAKAPSPCDCLYSAYGMDGAPWFASACCCCGITRGIELNADMVKKLLILCTLKIIILKNKIQLNFIFKYYYYY